MIHMKCQDFILWKEKVKLFSAAVVIGTLRVNRHVTEATDGKFLHFSQKTRLDSSLESYAVKNKNCLMFFTLRANSADDR